MQFYNQGDTKYDTYDQLFISAGGYFNGTAVKEIVARKIPRNMLVVGKPVTPGDASNTGWMDLTVFGNAVTRAYKEEHFYAGVMFWQYSSDKTGAGVTKAAGQLKDMCTADKTCI